MNWTCPYCGSIEASPQACPQCRRDPSAARRICPSCKRQTPSAEPTCCSCSYRFGSDLSWKIPLIIGIFLAGLVLSVALASVR